MEKGKKEPEKLRELKQLEKNHHRTCKAVEKVVFDLLEHSIPIKKAAKVK